MSLLSLFAFRRSAAQGDRGSSDCLPAASAWEGAMSALSDAAIDPAGEVSSAWAVGAASAWPLPGFSEEPAPYDLFRLDVENALGAFEVFLKSFGLSPRWASANQRKDLVHDLTLMLQLADLHALCLELRNPCNHLVLLFRIEFRSTDDLSPVDPARGFELPWLPPNSVSSYRLLMGPVYRFYDYAHRLRSRWRSAQPAAHYPPNCFLSKHLQAVSFQRLSAFIFVSELARRSGTILTVSPAADFALARCVDLPSPVFLHRSECDQPFLFRPGQKVSFVLIRTPRGYQGRNIRPG